MPSFKRETHLPDAEGYVAILSADDVTDGELAAVLIRKQKIIVTRYEGRLYAFDSACPHAAADLTKGSFSRWRICCREHDYCFDIRTGRIVWPEDEVYRLRRYDTKEEGGMVKVRLAPG